jgi:hypothetical protein
MSLSKATTVSTIFAEVLLIQFDTEKANLFDYAIFDIKGTVYFNWNHASYEHFDKR